MRHSPVTPRKLSFQGASPRYRTAIAGRWRQCPRRGPTARRRAAIAAGRHLLQHQLRREAVPAGGAWLGGGRPPLGVNLERGPENATLHSLCASLRECAESARRRAGQKCAPVCQCL